VSNRIGIFDVVRGFSVVSMVCFHACYDLVYLRGASLPFLSGFVIDAWRASISWTFLFVSGCMCVLVREGGNLTRALRYALVAVGIFVVTSVAAVDVPISFGVMYCIAACTLTYVVLDRLGLAPRGCVAALVLFTCFLVLLGLPRGYVGIGDVNAHLPRELYATPWLSWLGLPGPQFASGDYYPLLPYLLVYLSGAAMCSWWRQAGFPDWAADAKVGPLATIGRHSMAVYLVHQPVLIALLSFA